MLCTGCASSCPAAVSPRFFMDLPTPFSSVRMVGKKRKTTRSPRMNGVGIRRRDKNAESIPGGVVIRSQDTRKIGDRFQNIRTYNSEKTGMRSPWKRMPYSSSASSR